MRTRWGTGKLYTSTYETWVNMRTRCYNVKCANYPRYGGRGIRVCDRWLHGDGTRSGFECFLDDMGAKPEGLTIDRINNDGDYQPSNCIWATRRHQAVNRQRTVFIEYGGQTKCINDWARHFGASINSFRNRAKVRGSYHEAIASYETKPLRTQR